MVPKITCSTQMNQPKRDPNFEAKHLPKRPRSSHDLFQETYLELGTHRLPTVNELIRQHNLTLAEKRLQQIFQQCSTFPTLPQKYEPTEELANLPSTDSITSLLSLDEVDSNLTPELPCSSEEDNWLKDCWFIPSLMMKTPTIDEDLKGFFFDPTECGTFL
mmetsp:Transcript_26566/g.37393  ORF Transcript_26566/g.37393 Transcript_26566/m.37393 type:complete len:161 (-) Transcript_26566:102-584(-)